MPGYEPDVDGLRAALHALLDPVDSYAEVFDPYAGHELVTARCPTTWPTLWPTCCTASRTTPPAGRSRHCGGGSTRTCRRWGQGARAALRALQSLVAHVRLEVPIDVEHASDPL